MTSIPEHPCRQPHPHRNAGITCALALLMLLHAPQPAPAQAPDPPATLVRVGEVERREVREHRLIVGQVEPVRRSIVAAEEPGRVTHAPPDAGIAVRTGELLADIDTALLELEHQAAESRIREAEATVEEARAQLQLTTRERDRLEQLVASNVARQKELEDATDRQTADMARLSAVEASVYRNRSELARLEQRLKKSRIEAPFDAYIVRKQTEVGQWLAAGDPVAEIVQINPVKVRLDVPEAMIEQVPRDETLTLSIEALDHTVQARLFSVVPDADPRSRTFSILVHVPNENGRIKPGMSVRAHLPTSQRMEAITVPRDAVQTTPSGTVVFVNREGVAASVPVRVRFGLGDRFVVEDTTLQHGEQVVVQGNERLAHGQSLRIVADDPDTPGTAEADDEEPVDL